MFWVDRNNIAYPPVKYKELAEFMDKGAGF